MRVCGKCVGLWVQLESAYEESAERSPEHMKDARGECGDES